MLGASTVDTTGEYHSVRAPSEATSERDDLMGRPYGLGPRVPLYVVSPFARGGFVNSEVFDHTSVIRFCEARFGVMEPNISTWRRAVCGDLTSCFDFATPNDALASLPETANDAKRAAALPGRTTPPIPGQLVAPVQKSGLRRSRPLPYAFDVALTANAPPRITFRNTGSASAVFHVYNRLALDEPPRRYTVEPGKILQDEWPTGAYDLEVHAPNGFYRRFVDMKSVSAPLVTPVAVGRKLQLRFTNPGKVSRSVVVVSEPYGPDLKSWKTKLGPAGSANHLWDLSPTSGWYDLTVRIEGLDGWQQRFAGRLDAGVATMTDPALGGASTLNWS